MGILADRDGVRVITRLSWAAYLRLAALPGDNLRDTASRLLEDAVLATLLPPDAVVLPTPVWPPAMETK